MCCEICDTVLHTSSANVQLNHLHVWGTIECSLCCDESIAIITACGFTGVGGQIDFLRGAALGYDGLGKPIITMTSVTEDGESKIVPELKPGMRNIVHSNSFMLFMRA